MSEKVHSIMKELRRRLETLYGPRLVRMCAMARRLVARPSRARISMCCSSCKGQYLPERKSPEPVTSSLRSRSRTVWCSLARLCLQIGST